MISRVNYQTNNETESLHEFLKTISDGLKSILQEYDFRDLVQKSKLFDWTLFNNALNQSHKQFQERLEHVNLVSEESRFQLQALAGFTGFNLELKIFHWNGLVKRFKDGQEKMNRLNRPVRFRDNFFKQILKKILKFINIILSSSTVYLGDHSLEEIKKLAEWIIVDSLPDNIED